MVSLSKFTFGPVQTNSYLLCSQDYCVIVDPGTDNLEDISKIKDVLAGRELLAVLLTHAHYDHVLGAHFFNVPTYIHKDDQEFLNYQKEFIERRINGELILPEDIQTFDGDLKFKDITITVLHTPGHTWGSVCFLFDDFILTGDTLFAGCMGRTDVCDKESCEHLIANPRFHNPTAHVTLVASLKKLLGLDDELKVFCGHGWDSILKCEKEWIGDN
jgi:hydroxyacylglutathione hydrolase